MRKILYTKSSAAADDLKTEELLQPSLPTLSSVCYIYNNVRARVRENNGMHDQ